MSNTRKCVRCGKPSENSFYRGRRELRCGCPDDYRTPVEKRRDTVLDKYGDDPSAYTPAVLAALAKDGLFDITAAFCPAGKLTMAETRAREAAIAAAAREGGDAKQAPGSAPQSGGTAASPDPRRIA